jgi:hypothetical protein
LAASPPAADRLCYDALIEANTQHGYLVLADISGYTAYVAGVELAHANGVLSDLLQIIVERIGSLLTISKLEGDAVFAYTPEANLSRGELLLELLESTYVAFRDRQMGIKRRTTCECNACRRIPDLDLKLLTHYGDYLRQDVGGIPELLGSDVNLAHRLLKNHVSEATGWRAYMLFTANSVAHLGVSLPEAHAQIETYEHLGDVQTYSLDLHQRYQALTDARRVFVTAEEADLVLTQDFGAPAPVVWDWLNDPQKRTRWMHERTWKAGERLGGRTGVGARNHCAHGSTNAVETILDWRPFDYMTAEQRPNPKSRMVETIQLESLPDGRTRMSNHIKLEMGLPPWLKRPFVRHLITREARYKSDEIHAGLARMIEAELRETSPLPGATPEKTA